MFRATAPSAYSYSPNGNMFLYNDSLYLAEQLSLFASHKATRSSVRPHPLSLSVDVLALQTFGKRAYGAEMDAQRTVLRDLLDGAQGFVHCAEPPFAQACDVAVDSTADALRAAHARWRPVLSRSALLQSVGSLLATVVEKMIVDVEDMADISERESQALAGYCARISRLEDLFLPEEEEEGKGEGEGEGEEQERPFSLVAGYTPHWFKFQYLANVIESSLVDIKFLWTQGELSLEFEAEEVVDLIEALFADSEHRRRAIAEIRRSDSRRGLG